MTSDLRVNLIDYYQLQSNTSLLGTQLPSKGFIPKIFIQEIQKKYNLQQKQQENLHSQVTTTLPSLFREKSIDDVIGNVVSIDSPKKRKEIIHKLVKGTFDSEKDSIIIKKSQKRPINSRKNKLGLSNEVWMHSYSNLNRFNYHEPDFSFDQRLSIQPIAINQSHTTKSYNYTNTPLQQKSRIYHANGQTFTELDKSKFVKSQCNLNNSSINRIREQSHTLQEIHKMKETHNINRMKILNLHESQMKMLISHRSENPEVNSITSSRKKIQELRQKLLSRLKSKGDPHITYWVRLLSDEYVQDFMMEHKGYEMSIDSILLLMKGSLRIEDSIRNNDGIVLTQKIPSKDILELNYKPKLGSIKLKKNKMLGNYLFHKYDNQRLKPLKSNSYLEIININKGLSTSISTSTRIKDETKESIDMKISILPTTTQRTIKGNKLNDMKSSISRSLIQGSIQQSKIVEEYKPKKKPSVMS